MINKKLLIVKSAKRIYSWNFGKYCQRVPFVYWLIWTGLSEKEGVWPTRKTTTTTKE